MQEMPDLTIYAVGLIYNDEWEGKVIQYYSFWSDHKKAKEEALKQEPSFASAIVVQPFIIDNPQSFEPEIIKENGFVR